MFFPTVSPRKQATVGFPWMDRLTVNQRVAGSSPAGGANIHAVSQGRDRLRVGFSGKHSGNYLTFNLLMPFASGPNIEKPLVSPLLPTRYCNAFSSGLCATSSIGGIDSLGSYVFLGKHFSQNPLLSSAGVVWRWQVSLLCVSS